MQGGLQGCVLGDQRDQVSGLETTRALLKGGACCDRFSDSGSGEECIYAGMAPDPK